MLHKSHRDIVVEINRARPLRRNQRRLKTALRVNQNLRIHIEPEFLQQRWQIPQAAARVIQRCFALIEQVVEMFHRLIRGSLEILDRLMLVRHIRRIFQTLGERKTKAGKRRGTTNHQQDSGSHFQLHVNPSHVNPEPRYDEIG